MASTSITVASTSIPLRRLPYRGVDFQNRGVDFYTVASTSIPWRRLPNRGVDFHTGASTSKNELREASDTCCVYMPVQWVTQCSHRAAGQKMCHRLAPQAAQQLEAERAERDRRGAECGALREVWRACAAVASASVSGVRAEEGRSARGLVRGSTSFASTACFVLLYLFVFVFLRRSSTRVLIVLGSSSNRRRSRSPRAPRSAARAFGWGGVSRLGWVGRWARTHDDDAVAQAARARDSELHAWQARLGEASTLMIEQHAAGHRKDDALAALQASKDEALARKDDALAHRDHALALLEREVTTRERGRCRVGESRGRRERTERTRSSGRVVPRSRSSSVLSPSLPLSVPRRRSRRRREVARTPRDRWADARAKVGARHRRSTSATAAAAAPRPPLRVSATAREFDRPTDRIDVGG